MEINISKISCEFVRQVLKLIEHNKYVTTPCLTQINYYFSLLKQATSLSECLSYEELCELYTIINNLPDNEPDPIITLDCNDAVSININKKVAPCSYTVSLETLSGLPSAFPELVIENDTIYQSAYINVKAVGCSELEYYTAETGCIASNPITCQEIFKQELDLVFSIKGALGDVKFPNTAGYIKNLRVYETDSNGLVNPVPIDLDLAPSNLAAWTSCPLCSGVSPSQLFFGHTNWANAFKTLLDNVCYTLHGALTAIWSVDKFPTTDTIRIGSKIKHNPASEWLGIDRYDFLLRWINQQNAGIKVTNPGIVLAGTPTHMAEDFTIPMDCGNITGRVSMFTGQISPNHTSNWNQFKVNTNKLTVPATISNLVIPSCNKTTLTASYTLLSSSTDVAYVEWFDPLGESISFENSITVVDPGEYEFTIVFENGCITSKSITV